MNKDVIVETPEQREARFVKYRAWRAAEFEAGRLETQVNHSCGCYYRRPALAGDEPAVVYLDEPCTHHRAEEEYKAWLKVAKQRIARRLRRAGYRCERRARKTSGSSYYHREIPGSAHVHRIRVSDHDLPETAERSYYHSIGCRSYDAQIVLDEIITDAEIDEVLDGILEPADA